MKKPVICTYRLCEKKAIQISKISRLLKQNAIEVFNINQTKLTEINFNKSVKLILSNNKVVTFNIGDKPYTILYFESTCSYNCINNKNID